MKAKVASLFLVVGLIIGGAPAVTYAHSHLESTVPEDGQTVDEAVETIELSFDGGIEQASDVQIFTEAGDEIEPATVNINSPEIEVELTEPLMNGEYRVTFNVISADTHPVDGEFTFSVDAEEVAEPAEEATEEEATEEEITEEEPAESVETDQQTSDEQQDNEENSSMLWIIGGIVVLVVIIGAVVAMRKKK
ncbi:copper resistance CopC family protein [Alkalicoccobacillus murimartini]|uniref:Methionine-rich copper-binding protein CopC n=1 Tax=Alkalicoccobacillus murimartini TaxID=171685 RepID=A0ABT9YDQ1_9BACI|nr:copper resistance protein CopC [Alkalicoccobacillus murimartini]MDQ0205666.1 methionine-rich copper-binding protein CopC [Alkalicoccobacillus murimartini]